MVWWLSFATPNKLNGFLGVIIVSAEDFLEAVAMTHKAGINPGGEVRGYPMDINDPIQAETLETLPKMKLLSKAEIDKHGESARQA